MAGFAKLQKVKDMKVWYGPTFQLRMELSVLRHRTGKHHQCFRWWEINGPNKIKEAVAAFEKEHKLDSEFRKNEGFIFPKACGEQATYKDCIVTRKEVTRCGADWADRQAAGLPAGETVTMVEVIRVHPNGMREVLINTDPLFREAVDATSGQQNPSLPGQVSSKKPKRSAPEMTR